MTNENTNAAPTDLEKAAWDMLTLRREYENATGEQHPGNEQWQEKFVAGYAKLGEACMSEPAGVAGPSDAALNDLVRKFLNREDEYREREDDEENRFSDLERTQYRLMRAFALKALREHIAAQPPAAVQEPAVTRSTVIEWLDALDIEVTGAQLNGLFHTHPAPQQTAPQQDAALNEMLDAILEGLDREACPVLFMHEVDVVGKSFIANRAQLKPSAPVAQVDARDTAFEAVRQKMCKLPRYSFLIDSRGNLRRCEDSSGNWIEFDAAHALLDPVAVDAAISNRKAQKGGEV